MPDVQKRYTKHFIKEVKTLVETGVVKNYAEIADGMEWSRTSLSGVLKGIRDVPLAVYKKFTELYKIVPIEPENAQESPKKDYTDEYIALLKEKVDGFSSIEIRETLEQILAHQRLFYDLFEKLLSRDQKQEKGKSGIPVRYEMDKALAGYLRRIQKKDNLADNVHT